MVILKVCSKVLCEINDECINNKTIEHILELKNLKKNEYYLLENGKLANDDAIFYKNNVTIDVVLRENGGKGGFGSMLRAIGAQIEKTTNREACRDLSGRRLRDINEEQRLKNWIAAQPEREREAIERKLKKIEKLCEKPKHEFNDPEYEKLRAELLETVSNAVEQGLKRAQQNTTQTSQKRKANDVVKQVDVKKTKSKLWIDPDLDEFSSSCDDSSDDEQDKNDDKLSELNLIDPELRDDAYCQTNSKKSLQIHN